MLHRRRAPSSRHAGDYDQRRASVRTWLYAIARNRIIDQHRRAAVRPKRGDEDALDGVAEIDTALDHAVLRWQVTAALARLSPPHREVIRLAHYGGLTMREIAQQTGVPLGTVKSRTSYALRHLRLIFDEMEIEPWGRRLIHRDYLARNRQRAGTRRSGVGADSDCDVATGAATCSGHDRDPRGIA